MSWQFHQGIPLEVAEEPKPEPMWVCDRCGNPDSDGAPLCSDCEAVLDREWWEHRELGG